jgi:hypothetical protein
MIPLATEWTVHGDGVRRRTIRPARAVCRLTIAINGTDYQVKPIPAAACAARRAYRLSKADGTSYDVAEHFSPGEWEMPRGQRPCECHPTSGLSHREGGRRWITCDCPDWVFRRDGFDPDGCKHLKAMVEYGLFNRTGVAR